MSDYSTYFAYDIMGDLVFGKRFNCMTADSHRFVPKLLMSSSAFVYQVRPPLGPPLPTHHSKRRPTNTANRRSLTSPSNPSSAH